MPATAAQAMRDSTRALAANCSNDDVIKVGRHRVTPVASTCCSASSTRSAVRPAELKSIPPNPFT